MMSNGTAGSSRFSSAFLRRNSWQALSIVAGPTGPSSSDYLGGECTSLLITGIRPLGKFRSKLDQLGGFRDFDFGLCRHQTPTLFVASVLVRLDGLR